MYVSTILQLSPQSTPYPTLRGPLLDPDDEEPPLDPLPVEAEDEPEPLVVPLL